MICNAAAARSTKLVTILGNRWETICANGLNATLGKLIPLWFPREDLLHIGTANDSNKSSLIVSFVDICRLNTLILLLTLHHCPLKTNGRNPSCSDPLCFLSKPISRMASVFDGRRASIYNTSFACVFRSSNATFSSTATFEHVFLLTSLYGRCDST